MSLQFSEINIAVEAWQLMCFKINYICPQEGKTTLSHNLAMFKFVLSHTSFRMQIKTNYFRNLGNTSKKMQNNGKKKQEHSKILDNF